MLKFNPITAVLGGLFKNLLAGGAFKGTLKAATGPLLAKRAMNSFKFQAGLGAIFGLAFPGTPEEKLNNAAFNVGAAFLTMGMASNARQIAWTFGISMLPQFANMSRAVVGGYRSSLESRTSAAIPFSHSTMAMDQAFSTLQYSRSRVQEGYQHLGNNAAFYSAKYLSR